MGTTVTNSASGRRVGAGRSRMSAERPAPFQAGNTETKGWGFGNSRETAARAGATPPRPSRASALLGAQLLSEPPAELQRCGLGPSAHSTACRVPVPRPRGWHDPLETHAQHLAAPWGSRSGLGPRGFLARSREHLTAAKGTRSLQNPPCRVTALHLIPQVSAPHLRRQSPAPRRREPQAQQARPSSLTFER